MSPFRDAPEVELGPLDVGLEAAAARAMTAIPRGGRLVVVARRKSLAPYAIGALGSAGLLAVAAVVVVLAGTSWRPMTAGDVVVALSLLVAGGASLATVMRVTDRATLFGTRRGEEIGRAARKVVVRLARLASMARRTPNDFGSRRVRALRRTLAAASHPDVARWIPSDLRGRAELLLARSLARQAGPRWASNAKTAHEVRELLLDAAHHMASPAPAENDLDAIARSSAPHGARIEPAADDDARAVDAEEEAIAAASIPALRTRTL